MSTRRNIQKGAGPVYLYQRPVKNQITNRNGKYNTPTNRVNCTDTIDNTVTYTYIVNTDGNHLSYVSCGYVE